LIPITAVTVLNVSFFPAKTESIAHDLRPNPEI